MTEHSENLPLILDALAFAAHKHKDQRRKDVAASPYINHCIAVANVLVREGEVDDPITVCAALLHDTIEDTETTADELREMFGAEIRDIVLEVSDDTSLERMERKRLQVEHAAHISSRAKLVKLADKICNIFDVADHPPSGWSLTRRQEYFDWAKEVVERLRGVHPTLEQVFDRAYLQRPAG
jgi:guanosine-3',5'-bis(diphosphate) 3'-pyrophosphohydrolase